MWLMSPRRVVDALVHGAVIPARARGAAFAPCPCRALTVSVAEMVEAMREVAGDAVAARLCYEPDPFIERIVYGWATRFETPRALAMGFKADEHFREVVEAFIEDDLGGQFVR